MQPMKMTLCRNSMRDLQYFRKRKSLLYWNSARTEISGRTDGKICKDCNIESVYSADEGVELTVRKSDKGRIVFVINHNSKEAEVDFGTDKLKSLIDERKFTGKNTIQPGDVFVTIVEE